MQYIVPQPPRTTFGDVIADMERTFSTRKYPPVNYIFANNYYFTDSTSPATSTTTSTGDARVGTTGYGDLASRLVTLRYRRRAPLSVYGYAVKSIIDPMACLRMHNHYCWAVTPAYESRGYVELVSELFAVNQHYKRCHLNATECSSLLKASTSDSDTMDRYREKLVANVVQQVRAIFGLSPSEFLRQFGRRDAPS